MTKEAKRILYLMYKEYLDRRDRGYSREEARFFGGSETILEQLIPNSTIEDVNDCLNELSTTGYLSLDHGDDYVEDCELLPPGVEKIENLSKNAFLSFADFISKFF